MKKLIPLFLILTMLPGCALIFSGTRDKIHIREGNVQDAKVYVNGNYEGTAPCKVKVAKKGLKNGHTKVKISAEGYESQEVTLARRIKILALLGDCVTGFVPLIFDFGTGAIYKAYPQDIKYNLNKK